MCFYGLWAKSIVKVLFRNGLIINQPKIFLHNIKPLCYNIISGHLASLDLPLSRK